ncbi:acyl carrier protein [Salinarimonas rosea]|uniref:acyl carrier protein n=1 Tax=Salinarimonas rosea TaxID=552063 RepID=UPI001FD9D1F8|nr:acyl carrier protein [Salinarimonas rosea]
MARERPAAQDDADRALAPIEGLVRRTWAEVLGLSTGEIGAERCFFELGGDSIGANIVVRALAGHGLPVDIADVFEASTVRDLSRAILAKAPALPPELAPDATGPGGTGIDGGGPDRSRRASFDLPPGALASTAARVEVLARLLAALGTALRMATGASVLRVDLVGHPDLEVGTRRHTAAPVARLALEVGSLGRLAETVGAAHRALRQAATNVFASDIAIARSAGRAGKTAAVALTFADADSGGAGTVEAARREHPAAATPGVRVVASTTAGAIEIAVEGADEAAGDVAPELLLENFGFAWEQALGVAPLPAPAAQPATGRPPSVEPYNDVYYKDCTSHALLTAFRHFGGDPNAVLAGCTSACEVSESASEALRVRVRYLRARPDEDVMREAGVAVDRVAPRGRLVEALIALLDAGDLGVVKLDCYHVERKEELFGLKHGEHTMLVDGYDRAARRFHGVDSDASDSAHYRPVTIGFEEIERACAGYEAFFDPRGTQASLLRVSRAAGSAVAAGRSGDLARVAHETYARFLPERRAARAAWLRLGPALASLEDGADAGALVAWKYTIGNLVAAKRLEAHTLGEILRDEPAAASARRMVEALALVHAVLTKLQMTRSRDPHRTRALAARLDEIARLEAAHVEALETRVGGR